MEKVLPYITVIIVREDATPDLRNVFDWPGLLVLIGAQGTAFGTMTRILYRPCNRPVPRSVPLTRAPPLITD